MVSIRRASLGVAAAIAVLVPSVAVSAATFVLLYALGHLFFSLIVPGHGGRLPRSLFALTFAASGGLLLLVLLEVHGELLGARARWILWKLHLSLDLALLVIALPCTLLALLTRRLFRCSLPAACVGSLVPMAAWLLLFKKVGEPFPTFAPREPAAAREHREGRRD